MTVEERILTALAVHGRWTTIGHLAASLNVPRRDVEAAIESLRLRGEPVIGGNDGVKYTLDLTELEAYISGRRLRTAAIHRGTMALRSRLRRMRHGAQTSLWDTAA